MANDYNDAPQSRTEEILQATIDGTTYNDEPQSRVEKQLIDLKKKIESGGTGGGFTPTEAQLAAMNSGVNQHSVSQIADHEQRITKLEGLFPDTVVYGFHIDPNESDPSAAVTYLSQAVGMIPAKMGASTFDYGSWGNAFFMPKPCMLKYDGTVDYYLNPNDYTKKADGTASDVANADYEGNAMMEWGKIWYKFAGGSEEGEGYFYVSNHKIDETYHCWCNIDSQDNEIDHFYTAIYNGTGTDKLRSISGITLTSANGNGNTTTTQEITRATANNASEGVEWYTEVFSDRLLITALLVLLGKSLNTQAVFGQGLTSGSQAAKEAYITGTLNDKGLFYGSTSTSVACKYFGMENFHGCVWHRVAGCISVDNVVKTKLTYGHADGTTAEGYNQTGTGYKTEDKIPTSNGYVKKMKFSNRGFYPAAIGGSVTTYYADYFYQSAGTRYLLLGGNAVRGTNAGTFYFNLGNAPSNTNWDLAAALSCKPLLKKG